MTAAVMLEPRDAWTVQLFDPASFGTGVYVGAPPGGQFSLQGTTPFKTLSTEDVFNNNVTTEVEARAHADFQGFDVGTTVLASALTSGSGGARAYTGLTVSTDTPVQLAGSFTLEGSFQAEGQTILRACSSPFSTSMAASWPR